jgi:hypothetical protein
METNQTTNISPSQFPATAKQIEVLANLGVTITDGLTIGQASQLITAAQAARAMMAPTASQLAKLDYMRGKPLAGAGRREVSTSIAMLVALTNFRATGDAQALAVAISERFEKPVRAEAPVQPAVAQTEDDSVF